MARDVKEILESIDAAKAAEFSAKAAQAKSAEDIAAIAAEAGTELAADEADIIFSLLQKKSQEAISIDDLDNVAGGCNDPCCSFNC